MQNSHKLAALVLLFAVLVPFQVALAEGPFAQPPPPQSRPGEALVPASAPVAPMARGPFSVHEELARMAFRGGASLGIGGQSAPDRPLMGLELGLYAVAMNRLQLGVRLNGFFDVHRDRPRSATFEQRTNRVQVGVEAGYRLRLSRVFAAYLIPTAAIYATADLTRTKLGLVKDDRLYTAEERSTRWGATPAVGVSLQLGWIDLSYRYQIDVKDQRLSTHGFTVGMRF